MSVFIIQFNEANFDLIEKYAENFDFPVLHKILESPVAIKTESEALYENLEPWIQWYSFYTGLKFSEHKVFHLGDCIKEGHVSIFDRLASKGVSVGLFSSMNHKYNPDFKIFIPDPWTTTEPDGSFSSRIVCRSMRTLINENSSLRATPYSVFGLIWMMGLRGLFRPALIFRYMLAYVTSDRARLAGLFDRLLLEYSIRRSLKEDLSVSSIFLNGLAHVQHHYLKHALFRDGSDQIEMPCDGERIDPVGDALRLYDQSFKLLFNLMDAGHEIWIITGLTQEVHQENEHYWRFRSHDRVFQQLLQSRFECFPRMSRDFQLIFEYESEAIACTEILENCVIRNAEDEFPCFGNIDQVDNSVFASFVYGEQMKDVQMIYGDDVRIDLGDELVYVALKNAGHVQHGWAFSNMARNIEENTSPVCIWDLAESFVFQQTRAN